MSHFYCLDEEPFLIHEADTPAQARKIQKQRKLKRVYPSVTTVLSICKDPFIDSIYKPSKLVELSRMEENWNLDWRALERLTYGTRECPETGKQIPSSVFGTNVHKRMEEMIWDKTYGNKIGLTIEPSAYDKFCIPFLDFMEKEGVHPLATEKMVYCNKIKICGSVDLMAMKRSKSGLPNLTNNSVLYDYKCRTGVSKRKKAIVYPKDLWQLAIEAKMTGASSVVSVVIDSETAEHFHHEWSPEDIEQGTRVAQLCAKLYWMLRMK
jgi:hypothetical protein